MSDAAKAPAPPPRHWWQRWLSPELRAWLRRRLNGVKSFFLQRDLKRLAVLHGTDKWGDHWYVQHYARHFERLRKKEVTLLEIGIGGYENSRRGGGSLRMWRSYFRRGKIVGLDFHNKQPHAEKRIRIFQGDQSDEAFLRKLIGEIGRPDIIIDDGSHQNAHVRKTFEVLFPLLADNGIYVVEDTQTSYWPEYGGSSDDLQNAPTSLCLFKRLTDGLNYEEYLKPGYQPTYHDQHIVGMHFYHNLVFIQKGSNREGSNLLVNNSVRRVS
ncbi:MAG: class I SAM-dependent methyltransferase [Verrucomicrobiota bacterium]